MIESTCRTCNGVLLWQDCDTGGWWFHEVHPADDHDAVSSFDPAEEMDAYGRWVTLRRKA